MNIHLLAKTAPLPIDLLLEADPSLELVKEYCQKGACYVAEKDGNIIGVYVLLARRANTVEVMNISVLEAFQGQGIGKALMRDAIKNAKVAGYEWIQIGTGNSSINQLALYQKCGFRVTGIEQDFFIKHYSEEIFENGIQCRDMIKLTLRLQSKKNSLP
jgi:ribosomal protein S18 acetylase RimI-like enzyme